MTSNTVRITVGDNLNEVTLIVGSTVVDIDVVVVAESTIARIDIQNYEWHLIPLRADGTYTCT